MAMRRWHVLVSLSVMSLLACGSSDDSAANGAGAGTDDGGGGGGTSAGSGDASFSTNTGDGGAPDAAMSDAATSDATDGQSTTDAGALSDGVPFSAAGPWRYKLPATTPLASNSAALAAAIQADITKYYGTWSINTDGFSSPYYVVPPGTPTQTWTWNCGGGATIYSAFAASLVDIPTETGFLSSQGTDEEISIYSPETDTYWDFWQAKVDTSGKWSACYGGKIDHASTNAGIFGQGLGAVACGLPLAGWLMRIDELQAGVIEHALGFQMVSTQATNFSWPANRTDGKTVGANYPMEGQRFRLDPTFDVTTLKNAAERTIAKALQDYGMLLTDTSGAVILQAEDERPYAAAHGGVNPYTAIWGGVAVYSVLKDIPITKLQALPQDYGKDFMH